MVLESRRMNNAATPKIITLALVAALAMPCRPSSAQVNLPALGDVASEDLSPQAERRLGERIVAEARRERAIFRDAELNEYVGQLGSTLALTAGATVDFFVVQDSTINAFALPGGFVGVNTGLIWATQTESELASVLAHEIGHVTQRHIARMMSEQKSTGPALLAAMLLAIVASRSAGASGAALSQAAVTGAQAGALQQQLNFSRDAEREADRVGFQTLTSSGFAPQGMPDFFQRLQKASRLYDNNAPSYLRTHPLTVERLSDIENRARGAGYKPYVDTPTFFLARARVRALSSEAVEDLRHGQHGLPKVAQYYGLAVAQSLANDLVGARASLAQAMKESPGHPWLETLAVDLALRAGEVSQAVSLVQAAYARWPQSRPLRLTLVQSLQASGQHEAAVRFLREQLVLFPNDASLFELLAKSYAMLGQQVRQHQATAEMYQREGWLTEAIEQLEIAQRYARQEGGSAEEFMLASEIQARLREWRAQWLEEKARIAR